MPNFNDLQLREVFHFLFLERLLNISDPKLYVLKGGVNLRFFFSSPRYSEDMDLDVLAGSVQTLKKNGYKILQESSFIRTLQAFGIDNLILNDPKKAKQTQTTQRFRVRLQNAAGEEFPTKVEFSRRSTGDATGVKSETINPVVAQRYQRLSFSCQHYQANAAILQKIKALGGRKQVQARDAFDLYILHLGGHLTLDNVKSKLSEQEKESALSALMSLDYHAYRGQVVEFIEPGFRNQYESEATWQQITETLLELLE